MQPAKGQTGGPRRPSICARVVLSRGPAQGPKLEWQDLCKILFSIPTKREATRLWRSLPLGFAVKAVSDEELGLLRRRVERAGAVADLSPLPMAHDACARHPRLCGDRICPTCGDSWVCILCSDFEIVRGCGRCLHKHRLKAAFRRFRVATLLAVLAAVALTTYSSRQRLVGWRQPLTIGLYPVRAEPGIEVQQGVASLDESQFADLARFLSVEAANFGRSKLPPISITLGPPLAELPPTRPAVDAPWYEIVAWSLEMRLWARIAQWRFHLPPADIRLFLLYYTATPNRTLPHSLGLREGQIGIVYLFAGNEWAPYGLVAIAHELLHTLGATDKYDEDTGLPSYPAGFADPERQPLFPQSRAEIMAGRIPVSPTDAQFPNGLRECAIGPQTGREIGWSTAKSAPPSR